MKKIKSLIFKTSFILMLCLFTLISFKDNKAKAADDASPIIKVETSTTTVTPGSSFNIIISIDASNIKNASWTAISYFLYLTASEDKIVVGTPKAKNNDGTYDADAWIFQDEFYNNGDTYSTSSMDYNWNEEYYNITNGTRISVQVSPDPGKYIPISELGVFELRIPVQIKEGVDTSVIKFISEDMSQIMLTSDDGEELLYDEDDTPIIFEENPTVTITTPNQNTELNTVDITSTNGDKFNYTTDNLTDLINNTIDVSAETNKLSLNATALYNGSIESVTVNGQAADLNGSSYDINLLDAGSTNNIVITVESESKNNKEDFSFIVKRKKYNISTLDSLDFKLPSGVLGTIDLKKGDGNSYTLNLPDGEDSVLVKSVKLSVV